MPTPRIGAHVGVPGGLARGGLANADATGSEVVQVFVGNARSWATPAGSPADDAEFRAGCAARGLPVYVHASFLINLGSPEATTVERSVGALRHALVRARDIAARGVVVHTGSAVTAGFEAHSWGQTGRLLRSVLADLDESWPDLLLEPTAGQGRSLCSGLPEIERMVDLADGHPRLGVCLDTCHWHAAGEDLAGPGAMTAMLDRFADRLGADRLRLVHVNDSTGAAGSRLDRHASLGAGTIGAAAFAELVGHPAAAFAPLVVETPGDNVALASDIALLKAARVTAAH